MNVDDIGAACFGLVIGWITYRALRRREDQATLKDITVVVGALGGGAVTAIFQDTRLFAWYSIGLAIGFFLYIAIALWLDPEGAKVGMWLGQKVD